MFQRILAFGLVAVLSLGFLAACGSSDEDEPTAGASPAQSSNAPAIATATAQSEIADTWTPTPEPEGEEGGEAAGHDGPVELQVSAVDIAFDVKELEGPADTEFTITLTNNGAADHDFVIEGTDFRTNVLAAGSSETITVNLPAGEYTFFCSIPGHRPAGMEGTLIITEGSGAADAPDEGDAETDEAASGDAETDEEAADDADAADGAASGEPVALQVTAVDIDFLETELEAPADTDFTITLTNNGGAGHDFVIEGTDFKTQIVNGGASETITVNLPAGEYTYYCSVPGHRPAGMEGKLIVTEGGGASVAPAEESNSDEDVESASSPQASSDEPVALDIESVDIAYSITELEGPANTDFTITLTNNGAAQHDFVIEGTDFKTQLVDGGSSETITVNLPAGEYTFFCSVPGHRALMEGTLTITESSAASSSPDEAEGEEASADGEAVALEIESVDIAYSVTELEGPADTDFTITLTNNGGAQHDFVIEGTDFKTQLVNGGASETITVNLPAGEYTFYCSVPGHRALMEGTLKIG